MSNQPAVIGPDGVARPYIGGQALLEGVMMRSPHAFSAVVRRRNGSLVVRERPMLDVRRGKAAWPIVRGVVALMEALKLGSQALRFSAEIYERDLAEEEERVSAGRVGELVTQPRASRPDKLPLRGTSMLAALSLPIVHLMTAEPELGRRREQLEERRTHVQVEAEERRGARRKGLRQGDEQANGEHDAQDAHQALALGITGRPLP